MPSKEHPISTGHSEILEEFHGSYGIEENRRVVCLPKKTIYEHCANRCNAERRFQTLQKRLQKDDDFWATYEEQMLNYVVKQHVEIAPTREESNRLFYLPHHLVKEERRGKIKWRRVFDTSSREGNSPSLKDVLEMGPNLLPDVLTALLRFRKHPVAVNGDIQQAFLLLSLDQKDRDFAMFLWYRTSQDGKGGYYTTDEVVTYRFTLFFLF
jgi:hypothetical protein